MRRRLVLLLATALLLVIVSACGDGDRESGVSVATVPAAPPESTSPTSTAPTGELPAAPENLLAGAVPLSGYLEGAEARLETCLPEVVRAWGYAPIEGTRCLYADLDGDGERDYLWVATLPDDAASGDAWVFLGGAGFRLATSARALANIELVRVRLLATADLTGDGRPDPVITGEQCGVSTCTTSFVIVSGHFGTIENLAPPGLTISAIEESIVADATGDGLLDLQIRGGTVSSVGAGPPRAEEIVLHWGGLRFVEQHHRDDPQYLIHAIADADERFLARDWSSAEAAYLAAAGDVALRDWQLETMGIPGRSELAAYATLRAGLAAYRGGDHARGIELIQLAGQNPSLVHGEAAAALADGLFRGESLSESCAAAIDTLDSRRDEFIAIWDYGYDNPSHFIDALCD